MIKKYRENHNLFLVVAFLMMGILFYSSSQTYEQQSQIGLLSRLLKNEPFKETLANISFSYAGNEVSIANKGYFAFIEFFIRKGAHFMTYFILGSSFFLGLELRLKNFVLTTFVAWLAATGYAALDEFHQMLTGGRTPLFQDVVLDSIGALTGIVFCWLIMGWREKRLY